MEFGPDPSDRDDVIQRYGRRLFVLAYHLTGDAAEAAELSLESLIRGLLAPDFPSGAREAGIYLHRGLVSLWRERADQVRRGANLRVVGGAAGWEAASAPKEHAGLWLALSRLDPVSRAVLVLRVAGGLEYETIGRVLDMAPDVVYARLLQARSGLQDGERTIEPSMFETMNLFLDDRLPREQRAAFEKRLMTDAALRDRVEFHRGLALDLHEEAPALPRDYIDRLRERLDRGRETLALVDQVAQTAGWEPAAATPGPEASRAATGRPWRFIAILSGAAIVLVIGVVLGGWAARRRPPAPAPGPEGAAVEAPARPGATPDEATVEALRSLGYLAPAKEQPKKRADGPAEPRAGAAAAGTTPKPAASPVALVTKPSPLPAASPSPSPIVIAAPTPAPAPPGAAPAVPTPTASQEGAATEAASPASTPSATPSATPSEAPPLAWRVIPVGRAPATGREFQVIRTTLEWNALFEGAGEPPAVNFDERMVVLLRSELPGEPPARLKVAAVRNTGEALLFECGRESPEAGAPPADAAAAGLAVVVPLSDLPIRVVVP
ncbi:MAG TPA: sigma factor-like helix-turn-helix DNA-binding protein [Candidatus Polarisedimenticolia bacterium]|nr:sigma factor-like helix-turn-helix DNA-binding protein [Candidatus Polarisedimenticolia bacterium]